MAFISCQGHVYSNGAAIPNAVVAHVCGATCPSWNTNNAAQKATTNALGYYALQFDAGLPGSQHRLASTVPGNAGYGVSADSWVTVTPGVTATLDFQLP